MASPRPLSATSASEEALEDPMVDATAAAAKLLMDESIYKDKKEK